MSSLKPEDAVSDYSTLDEKQMKVLDDWVSTAVLGYQRLAMLMFIVFHHSLHTTQSDTISLGS